MKITKGPKFISGILFVIGLIFSILVIFILCSPTREELESATATVTDVELKDKYKRADDYIVHIVYIYNGKQYKSTLHPGYKNPYKIGDKETIYFKAENPQSLVNLEFASRLPLFVAIGVPTLLLGSIGLILAYRQKKNKKKLIATGHYLIATIDEIKPLTNFKTNKNYKIYCHANYPPTGETLHFVSETINKYTQEYFTNNNITTIKVYINTNNLNDYHLDLSDSAFE